MKKLLIALAFLLVPLFANATDNYFCSCSAGADGLCVAGSDANPGTAASPFLTMTKVGTVFNAAAAGDRLLFCKGGAWAAVALSQLTSSNSTAASPITFDWYIPVGTCSACAEKPIFASAANTYAITFDNGGSSVHDEGYVIAHIDFESAGGTSGSALRFHNDVWYVTLDSITVNAYGANGVEIIGDIGTIASGDGTMRHYIVRNSTFTNNKGIGLYVGADEVLIEGNTFSHNGTLVTDHQIYFGDLVQVSTLTTIVQTQNIIRNNILTNANVGANGSCVSVAMVIHGRHTGLIVEGNTVREDTVPTGVGCWGINVDMGYDSQGAPYNAEGFQQVAIRNNNVANYSVGIGLDICQHCVVENNSVYSADTHDAMGIVFRDKYTQAIIAQELPPTDIVIRNNSVYIAAPTLGSFGIGLKLNAGDTGSLVGTGFSVISNLIYFASGSTAATSCFNTLNMPVGKISVFDYNLCFYAGTQGLWAGGLSKAAWVSANPTFDTHSITTDPTITTPTATAFSLAIPTGSPAKNTGHPTLSSRLGFGGVVRDASPDIGAYEFGASGAVPSTDTRIKVQ